MARVVLSGYMIRHPVAGNLFAFFHYALGLHRLGHDVIYVEERGWPGSCYDPYTRQHGDDPASGLATTRRLFDAHDVPAQICFFDGDTSETHGAARDELLEMLESADVLLDVGGSCWHPTFERCARKVLVDLDPLFTQLGRYGGHKLEQYDACFSVGVNVGNADCPIPTRGVEWHPTVPPVVTDLWRDLPLPERRERWTTVTNWHSYEPIEHRGEKYGQKDVEFLKLADLPGHTEETLELAIAGGGPGPKEHLMRAGWLVRDAEALSLDIAGYQAYIAGARGEFSVAKHAYVATRSGWFSDRSVCYLAAGCPVVLQDTGFRSWLDVELGVVCFSDLEGAVRALREVAAAYDDHARAARELADRVFSYEHVLPRLLAPPPTTSVQLPPNLEQRS